MKDSLVQIFECGKHPKFPSYNVDIVKSVQVLFSLEELTAEQGRG